MNEQMEAMEARWRDALEREDTVVVEEMVRDILRNHPKSALASQIRYQRGVLALTAGEGRGSERLAKAMAEFDLGVRAGEAAGAAAEPWRSLNRTQLATCNARLGNTKAAVEGLREVAEYQPRSVAGLGALGILVKILQQDNNPREASRYSTQRISYARALVREAKDASPEEMHQLRLILAQELLDSPYTKEGLEILEDLKALGEEVVGRETYADTLLALEHYGASSS